MTTPPITQAEYLKIPSINFPRKRWLLKGMNWVMALERRKMVWDARIKRRFHQIKRQDGSYLKVMEISCRDVKKGAKTLLYFHSGGFFLTYARGHLERLQDYVLGIQGRAFLVDYRLSTTHAFPYGFEDCYRTLAWLYGWAPRLDLQKLVVLGDSAGGGLAASVTQKARDEGKYPIAAQCLIYPVIDCETKTKSAIEFTDARVWNTKNNRLMWRLYLRDYPPGAIPLYASPIHHENLSDLPPAYIELAELDPLRDEGLAYAHALKASGTKVQTQLIKGAPHGFDFAPSCAPIEAAVQDRIDFLNSV